MKKEYQSPKTMVYTYVPEAMLASSPGLNDELGGMTNCLTNATLDGMLRHGMKPRNNQKNSRLLVESRREFFGHE